MGSPGLSLTVSDSVMLLRKGVNVRIILPSLAIALITIAAFLQAFFPKALPTLYNSWYSLTGMKTRVSVEDYQRWSVRSIGIAVLVLEIGVAVYRLSLRVDR
jgi:hypothetical protein